jgi:hypothetical protein
VGPMALPPQVETLLRAAPDALEDCFAIYRPVRGAGGAVSDFVIEHLNEAGCADMGRPRDQLVGRRLGELDPAYPGSADFGWLCGVLEGGRSDSRATFVSDVRAAPVGGGRLVITGACLGLLGAGAVLRPEAAQNGRAKVSLADEGRRTA